MLLISLAFAALIESAAVPTPEKPMQVIKLEAPQEVKKPEKKEEKPEPPSAYPPAEEKKPSEEITIVADEWCPYNCTATSEKPGYVVELAREIFAEQNIKVKYKVLPWERALKQTSNGEYQGIIGIAKKEGGNNYIYPANEVGVNINYFYVKTPSYWHYENESSLEFATIGLVQGYSYADLGNYVQTYKDDNLRIQITTTENPVATNVKKLLAGRITAIYEDRFVQEYYLNKENIKDLVTRAGTAHKKITPEEDYIYLAFPKKNAKSKQYAKIFNSGLEKWRKNGKLEELMKKYKLEDWENLKKNVQKP